MDKGGFEAYKSINNDQNTRYASTERKVLNKSKSINNFASLNSSKSWVSPKIISVPTIKNMNTTRSESRLDKIVNKFVEKKVIFVKHRKTISYFSNNELYYS